MQRIPPILRRPLPVMAKLFRDRRGAAAVILAIALSGIVGFAGLGSEVAGWYYITRSMQGAADSSAQNARVTPGTGRPIVTSPSGSGVVS